MNQLTHEDILSVIEDQLEYWLRQLENVKCSESELRNIQGAIIGLRLQLKELDKKNNPNSAGQILNE